MALSLVTPPTEEPVSLAEALGHLRVDHSDADARIDGHIVTARENAEAFCRRAFVTQVWDLVLPRFPTRDELVNDRVLRAIRIPKPPLVTIDSVTYFDEDGDSQTLATATYYAVTQTHPGWMARQVDQTWPATRARADAVTVQFTAGYGAASAVPRSIRDAILLDVEALFDGFPIGPGHEAYDTYVRLLNPHALPEAKAA